MEPTQLESNSTDNPAKWTGNFGFYAAAIGSAIGLANIWKFSYVAGANGGGAFVLVYVAALLLFALPATIAEFAIGNLGEGSAVRTISKLIEHNGLNKYWRWFPRIAMVGLFCAISLYCVVAGWTIDYIWMAFQGRYQLQEDLQVVSLFSAMTANPVRMVLSQSVFLLITLGVLGFGVKNGLERFLKFALPLLVVSLLVLLGLAVVVGDFKAGFDFLFIADFSKLTPSVILMAVGQAFFSLGVGFCVLMTIAAYSKSSISIPKATTIVVLADGGIAILAGLAVFPIVFAFGLEPAQGPGLVFETLPIAFSQIEYGNFYGGVFFLMLALAALTSSVTLLEALVASTQTMTLMSRSKCLIWLGIGLFVFGLGSVFSFNIGSEFYPLYFIEKFSDKTFFDVVDYVVSNMLFPLGGICVALIAGWSLDQNLLKNEFKLPGIMFRIWQYLVRFLIPVFIGIILVMNV
jgi:NSS family neurotransmitter:Na+ symporter